MKSTEHLTFKLKVGVDTELSPQFPMFTLHLARKEFETFFSNMMLVKIIIDNG